MNGFYAHPFPAGKDEPKNQTFYDPNFKFMIGRGDVIDSDYPKHRMEVDFSSHPSVKRFQKALKSMAVEMWFRHLQRFTGYWVFGPEAARKHHAIGVLVGEGFFDEEPILWIHKFVENNLAGKIESDIMDDVRFNLHKAVRDNDLIKLWNAFFNPDLVEASPGLPIPLDDMLWFRVWGFVRPELVGPPPKIIGYYKLMRLREIKELPPFFQLLDKVYTSWINAGKPILRSTKIAAVVERAVKLYLERLEKINALRTHTLDDEFGIRCEIMDRVTRKIDRYVNGLDWGFPI
jgi:hypothetical protein